MSINLPTGKDIFTEDQLNEKLLLAAIKLNTWLLAGVFASVFGLTLFGLTYLSLFRGLPDSGQYLNLLGVFLPGYQVSQAGAWIGLFWGATLGAFFAVLFYRIYVRSMDAQIQRLLDPGLDVDQLTGATLYFDGKLMGLALGSVVAGGLVVSTNWLVFRGTADESVHALLLVNYLPGYAINFPGSMVGALEVFTLVFLLSWLFSRIYNALASPRRGVPQ